MNNRAAEPPYEPLEDGEEVLDSSDELLFRQATTPLWDAMKGVPSSTSFGPMPIDEGKPSFSRSSKTTAQASRDWQNRNGSKPSHGVWACSLEEVHDGDTRAVDDSKLPTSKAPGHSYVDFRHLTKPQVRVLRTFLLAKALERAEIPTTGPDKAS